MNILDSLSNLNLDQAINTGLGVYNTVAKNQTLTPAQTAAGTAAATKGNGPNSSAPNVAPPGPASKSWMKGALIATGVALVLGLVTWLIVREH